MRQPWEKWISEGCSIFVFCAAEDLFDSSCRTPEVGTSSQTILFSTMLRNVTQGLKTSTNFLAGTSGGFLWNFGFHKRRGTSSLPFLAKCTVKSSTEKRGPAKTLDKHLTHETRAYRVALSLLPWRALNNMCLQREHLSDTVALATASRISTATAKNSWQSWPALCLIVASQDSNKSGQMPRQMQASTSETSVNFYEITRLNIPQDSHVHPVSTFKSTLLLLYFICAFYILLFNCTNCKKNLKILQFTTFRSLSLTPLQGRNKERTCSVVPVKQS
jgi:hypothetical protein